MKAVGLAQLILFVTSLSLITASQGDCPPWFFPDTDNGTECVCSNAETDKVIKCSKDTASLKIGVCMAYNNETKDTEIGQCPYILQHSNFSSDNLYFRLPKHIYNLTSFMCGPLHRKGLLCGKCEDGSGPALYSYTLECKKCWGHSFGCMFSKWKGRKESLNCFGLIAGSTLVLILHNVCKFAGVAIQFGLT